MPAAAAPSPVPFPAEAAGAGGGLVALAVAAAADASAAVRETSSPDDDSESWLRRPPPRRAGRDLSFPVAFPAVVGAPADPGVPLGAADSAASGSTGAWSAAFRRLQRAARSGSLFETATARSHTEPSTGAPGRLDRAGWHTARAPGPCESAGSGHGRRGALKTDAAGGAVRRKAGTMAAGRAAGALESRRMAA